MEVNELASNSQPPIRHYLEEMPNLPGAIFIRSLALFHPQANSLKKECESYNFQPLSICTSKIFLLFSLGEYLAGAKKNRALCFLASKACYILSIPGFIISRIVDFIFGLIAAAAAHISFTFDRKWSVLAISHLPIHFIAADISKALAAFFSFPLKDPREIF